MATILLIDDEEATLLSYDTILRMQGHEDIVWCSDSRQALELAKSKSPEVVLLDLTMPKRSGMEVLADLRAGFPDIPVLVVTGNDDTDTVVSCIKQGAHDYLVKPVPRARLETAVRQALDVGLLRNENSRLRGRLLRSERLDHPEAFAGILTQNERMLALFQYVETVAPSRFPVLITGETGAGKELFAQALHAASKTKGRFVAVNVAGLDDNVFSDTLFGHAKGAFTGADAVRKGLVEEAAGGTLFLDEIGDLSAASQVKLLRLLELGEYLPLGQDKVRRTTARIVVATNRNPRDLREGGSFRQDLYFRLASHHIHVPPLRERLDDLPLLLHHYLEEATQSMGRPKLELPSGLLSWLSPHGFPGNVRELRALVFHAVSQHKSGRLSVEDFRSGLAGSGQDQVKGAPAPGRETVQFGTRLPTIHEMKALLIDEALRRTGGNKSAAAELIGITRQAINWRARH